MADRGRRGIFTLIRRGVVFELQLYRSLFRWVTRRPGVPNRDVEVAGYAKAVTPVMWLWIFASALEIPLIHVLIPWPTVRIILLAVSVWGLVWMIGLLASLNVYPHLLSDTVLRIRYGASLDMAVPWDAIESIKMQRRDLPSSIRTLQPAEIKSGIDLRVGVSGQVNVHAELRHPLTLPTPKGEMEVSAFSFLVDDPRAFVAHARRKLSSARDVRR